MKNRFNFIIFAFILLLTSCIKDKAQEEEKVSVVLTFNTRSVSETYDTDSGEGIQSIRVIIAQNGTVVKNEYYPELSYNASLSQYSMYPWEMRISISSPMPINQGLRIGHPTMSGKHHRSTY